MSGGGGWLDRLVGGCVSLLIAAFALYCAASLLEAVLPTLMLVVGIAALVGLVIGAVVVFRTWRDRW
ncbi:hypothetical protein H7J87_15470 [Mycolicibacterium wolinskyi]|uniref:Uncharacterized protein n=1 Tax=Mycolicibacterium wolinskyi TaxID=59750 RepID=A0A1X2F891_9MYCO|nr:hypothetical protein [Mycolicibacterium wolinskyi]MCV7293707.1 hypothetical protein [Mycolicibacterium goodii]ORX14578.1 hypothetical protein AWC31_25685 [Mycolicibacterium wolinskyi]